MCGKKAMSGVPNINVAESVEDLKSLLKQQVTSLNFAKVQSLYLLKIKEVETVRHLAVLIGRSERTIHRWLSCYREGGIENLLSEPEKLGRPKKISVEEAALIQNELKDPEGFQSYKEIHFWLSIILEIPTSYITVYRLVRNELQAKLKVARPQNLKQLPGEVKIFQNNLSEQLQALLEKESEKVSQYLKVRFWCQDESRFGCHTIVRDKITIKGIKPLGNFQYNFQYLWLYGLIEPRTGSSFFYEFSHLDGECFNQYLTLFSQAFSEELHIIQLDNAPAHTATDLEIPDNIILFYQPPYCPEVNPIERVWLYLKNLLAWGNFNSLDNLRSKLYHLLNSLSNDTSGYLTGWSWILEALCLSGI